jgi:hypothetical protein
MTESELEELLDQIRRGRRLEGASLDWKRQWWSLERNEGKDEFRRDVVAIANSATDRGIILIGYKDGVTFSAPPPLDEARVQQILQTVSPRPNVRLEVFQPTSEGGHRISVLLLEPPFDRPYVERRGSQHYVWVRHGSSTGTASRHDLDAFYRRSEPQALLEAAWRVWEVGTHPWDRKATSEAAELQVAEPRIRLHEIPDHLNERLEQFRLQAKSTGYPSSEQIEQYGAAIEPFLGSLGDRANLVHWYCNEWAKFLHDGVPFSVSFINSGQRPATDCKLRIEFPDWHQIGKEKPERPSHYVAPPHIPPPPRPPARPSPQSELERMLSPLVRAGGLDPMTHLSLDVVRHLPSLPPTSGAWIDRGHSATFWADRVLQDHQYEVDATMYAVALPTAPESGSSELAAEVFCEEQPGWQPCRLLLRLYTRTQEPFGPK